MGADDEYKAVSRGGLKLKGVKKSRVEKHKKSKKDKKGPQDSQPYQDASEVTDETSHKEGDRDSNPPLEDDGSKVSLADEGSVLERGATSSTKTEAERRHEEQRRKRLDERLRREGSKTHKERVEELNRYLSGLSEHHDMPRIGPG